MPIFVLIVSHEAIVICTYRAWYIPHLLPIISLVTLAVFPEIPVVVRSSPSMASDGTRKRRHLTEACTSSAEFDRVES